LDVYSRKVVGWAMENHLRTELVLEALQNAISQRRPQGVIHHSDRGCQGGFNRSLQHLKSGGCNDEAKTIRSGGTGQAVLARKATGGAARGA
jgi:hypothetical protein